MRCARLGRWRSNRSGQLEIGNERRTAEVRGCFCGPSNFVHGERALAPAPRLAPKGRARTWGTFNVSPSTFAAFQSLVTSSLASGGFGVDWAFFERDVDLVAESGQGFTDGAGWNLKHGSGVDANGGQTPGFEVLFDMNHDTFAVKVNGVDGKTHGEGVDSPGRADPEALAGGELGGIGGHEAAETGPVGTGDDEIGREIGGASTVESVSLRLARWHGRASICNWRFVICNLKTGRAAVPLLNRITNYKSPITDLLSVWPA